MSERNVPIRLLVRNPERAREVLRPFITNPNSTLAPSSMRSHLCDMHAKAFFIFCHVTSTVVEFVQGDLTRPETLNEPVKNVSGVINVSGPTDTFFGTNTVYGMLQNHENRASVTAVILFHNRSLSVSVGLSNLH
jgi:uncharacterized protein YbjT (DUF2867 family)